MTVGPSALQRGRSDPVGWRPTLAVAAILAIVVLGGQLLNDTLPARGAATVDGGAVCAAAAQCGSGEVAFTPAAGWSIGDRAPDGTISLTQGDVELDVSSGPSEASPSQVVERLRQDVASQAEQIHFGDLRTSQLDGAAAAMVAYSGVFPNVGLPVDGELIALSFATAPRPQVAVFHAFAPQGQLDAANPDVEAMVRSARPVP